MTNSAIPKISFYSHQLIPLSQNQMVKSFLSSFLPYQTKCVQLTVQKTKHVCLHYSEHVLLINL